jgi:branched-chain amino acid transport system substrate-binding protein
MVVAEENYEPAEPSIDSHIVKIQSAGTDVFISFTTPKFAAQSIKKVAELGWKPFFILANVGSLVGTVMKPAGLENSQGIISATYLKDATDPKWRDDPGILRFEAFVKGYYPEGNRSDGSLLYGYSVAETIVRVLTACGNDLTRENVMRQAASLTDLQLDGLLPGITINTSSTDFAPIKRLRLEKFTGERWELFGDVGTASDQ